MAARLGIEPRLSESESLVLPLHNRAVDIDYCWDGARAGGNIDTVDRKMEPAMGFEPATACLQNRCSTIELRRPTIFYDQVVKVNVADFYATFLR